MPLTQHSAKLDQVQRGKDWQNANRAIKSAASEGSLPQMFGRTAEACERAYESLKPSEQVTIQDVSADTRTAIYMLAASFQDGDNDREHVKAVQHLLDNVADEAAQIA